MNTKDILDLAAKWSNRNGSAELCYQDACNLALKGKEEYAKKRAIDSLKHSAGVCHPDYKKACDK